MGLSSADADLHEPARAAGPRMSRRALPITPDLVLRAVIVAFGVTALVVFLTR